MIAPTTPMLDARDSFWEAFDGWQSAKRDGDLAAIASAKEELERRRAPFTREVDAWLLTQAAAESVTPADPVHLAEAATDADTACSSSSSAPAPLE